MDATDYPAAVAALQNLDSSKLCPKTLQDSVITVGVLASQAERENGFVYKGGI